MEENKYLKIVKVSAFYDLIVTAGFATPWTFKWMHELLRTMAPLPDFQSMHMLFANLMGSIVIVWSILRLRHTQSLFGFYDGIGRILFFTCQMYYLIGFNEPWIIGIFAIFEIGFGIIQLYGYWRLQTKF